MARALAANSLAMVALVLSLTCAAATPPQASAAAPGLRGKNATAPGARPSNGTLLGHAGAGSCTAEDEAKMARLGSGNAQDTFPFLLSACGKNSWSLFGGFSTRDYEACVRRSTQVTPRCASCFSRSAVYGYKNCKFDCMMSWCSRSCLRCVNPSVPAVRQCAGVAVPTTTPC